jgi:hypothetical protein
LRAAKKADAQFLAEMAENNREEGLWCGALAFHAFKTKKE